MGLFALQVLVCLGTAHVLGDFVFQSEYIIIGTMMSFGYGLLIALVAQYLLALSWT